MNIKCGMLWFPSLFVICAERLRISKLRHFVVMISLMCFSATFPTATNAMPVDFRTLVGGEFFADNSLLKLTKDWYYSGSLPSFDLGYIDSHVDECPLIFCSDTKQTVTAHRTMSYAAGPDASYSLVLQGEFQTDVHDEWNGNLVDHSKSGGIIGNHHDDDANKLIRSGAEPSGIEAGFASATGYKIPDDKYAQFSRDYSVAADIFNPGQFGCPEFIPGSSAATTFCQFSEVWFAGSAQLSANMQAIGDISDDVFGLEEVEIQLSADRTTRFLVNNQTYATLANIESTHTSFGIDDAGQFGGINFKLGGTVSVNEGGASISVPELISGSWTPKDERASFTMSYNKVAEMGRFESAGKENSYIVSVRDDPHSQAGIDGLDFTRALAYSSIGMSQLESNTKIVAKAVSGGNLHIDHALLWGWNPAPTIPDGGFSEDRPVFLDLRFSNTGALAITLKEMNFTLEELDIWPFDDFLDSISYTATRTLQPGQSLRLGLPMLIAQSALNAADDFLEGNHLELHGFGDYSYSDIYGTRRTHFVAAIIPEPTSVFVLGLLMMGITLGCRGSSKYLVFSGL